MYTFGNLAKLIRDNISPLECPNAHYIGLEHIGKGNLHLMSTGRASDVTSSKSKFQAGDILFGKLNPHFRKVIRTNFSGICSTDIWVIRPTNIVNKEFLFYIMASQKFVDFVTQGREGTGLPRAKWEHASQFEINLPSIQEQQSIAHILGSLDDKIELNRRMNETLEEMARALFKSWFVDFDPVRAKMDSRWRPGQSLLGLPAELYDLFPDRLIPSELGNIPEGWQVRQLEETAQSLTKKDNPLKSPDQPFCHYSIPAYDKNMLPKIELGQNIKSIKIRVKENTVLISRINPENNRVWLVDMKPDERAICSTEFLVLEPKPSFSRNYIYCLALTNKFREQIKSLVTGTSKSHQRAPASAIMCLETIIPTPAILRSFELYTSDMLNQILVNRREIQTLSELRDTLLPKLLSGEIRVDELDIKL